jgi:hypothetical protein
LRHHRLVIGVIGVIGESLAFFEEQMLSIEYVLWKGLRATSSPKTHLIEVKNGPKKGSISSDLLLTVLPRDGAKPVSGGFETLCP